VVVIRLARSGKKKQAFYRVVVADSKRAVTSKFISIVGWYNPHTKELNLKQDEVSEWLKKGAVPSNSVAVLLKNAGIKLPEWVKITEKVSKPKKEVEEKPQAPAAPAQEAPAAEAEENTAEEVAEETPVAETTEETPEAPAEETPAEAEGE
jgi:small subunit ribosomal protein S16